MNFFRLRCGLVTLMTCVSPLVAQQPDTAPLAPVGAYRSPTGGLFLVGSATTGDIVVRDLEEGLRGRFVAGGPDRFEQSGVMLRLLRESGVITGLEVRPPGGTTRVLARVPLRFESVEWSADGARLAGTLVLPEGAGPFPLIIAQPGSSWQTRYNEHGMFTALTFAADGFAGLAYDKRGFGASQGEQLVAFRRTAADLAAGVDAMRRRFDIDPRQIGVFGLSQGGWIGPLANTMTDGIRFMVLVGAPGTSPARQEIQRAVQVLRANGSPESEIDAIREFQELAFHYGSTGRGWPQYLDARRRAEGKEWLRRVWSPTEPGAGNWMWGRLNGDYNPLPALLGLDVPVLSMWGEFDLNVDAEVHRSIFEVALNAAGNPDHTLLVVPNADHELEAADSPRDALANRRFAPDVWRQMTSWIKERLSP